MQWSATACAPLLRYLCGEILVIAMIAQRVEPGHAGYGAVTVTAPYDMSRILWVRRPCTSGGFCRVHSWPVLQQRSQALPAVLGCREKLQWGSGAGTCRLVKRPSFID